MLAAPTAECCDSLWALSEHERIMNAIDAQNPEAAYEAARQHVELLGDQLADFISTLSPQM